MSLMQQPRELFPLRRASLHGGLEQCFLDVARHVAPDVHRRPSKQARKMVNSTVHPALLWHGKGTAATVRRSSAIIVKRRGLFCVEQTGIVLTRPADPGTPPPGRTDPRRSG